MVIKTGKKIVLSTIVDEEFANTVKKHCEQNGLTPSSLIKALLEEEINGKKSLTAIYNDIYNKYQKLMEWHDKTTKILDETIAFLDKFWKTYREDTQKIADTLKPIIEGQKLSVEFLEKLDARVKSLESQLDSRVKSLESQNQRIANILEKLAELALSK